jgi:hypothetical protein
VWECGLAFHQAQSPLAPAASNGEPKRRGRKPRRTGHNLLGRVYWYAWRGGPRLEGEPGTPAFIASYNQAIEEYRAPDNSRFRSLITGYKASLDYKRLELSTKQNWAPWLPVLPLPSHYGK